MKKLFILALTLFTFSLSANSQSEPDTKWLTYETEEFSVQYPEDWELDNSGTFGSSFFLYSPLASFLDDFRDNISLISEDISAYNLDLDNYLDLSKKQIKTLIKDAEFKTEERKELNGLEFYEVVYTGKQASYSLIVKQYFWIINTKAYVASFTCKADVDEATQSVGSAILKTIKLNTDFKEEDIEKGKIIVKGELSTYSTDDFSIQYPNDWQANDNGHIGTSIIMYAPTSTSEDDYFKENVNLMMQDVTEFDVDLEEYVDINLSQLKVTITNFEIISIREKTRDDLTYYQIFATGEQGEKNIKFKQHYWIVDDMAYVVSYTSETEVFDTNLPAAEKIMESFVIKN